MIKVLVVDDSALIRRILTDILNKEKKISVVGTAKNGKEALEKIEILKPDIITLDIEMPIMDGMTALKHIVSRYKLPVIMISTLSQEGAELTLEALDQGAIDFLAKPTNVFRLDQRDIKEEIIEKVKAASKLKPSIKRKTKNTMIKNSPSMRTIKNNENFKTILAVGTSTGGPRALQSLLPDIPGNVNASIVIVQHMPAKFTKSLADRLDSISEISIKEAEDGDVLRRGCGYIAPGDYHMQIKDLNGKLTIKLNQKPKIMGLRPTVDILMESVASIPTHTKIGVILTGMGSDGAKGILAMKKNGAYTIAQDQATSTVYGMPRAAFETGAIDDVLALDIIAEKLINKLGV